jgi:hypothetical protein
MGAEVVVLDRSLPRLRYLDDVFGREFRTAHANAGTVAEAIAEADLVIGAVLIPGAAAPKLVTRQQLSTMKPGAAIVDVAIDQGGCFETSRATTHADPIYEVDGIMHYCVANMPGAVARTSALGLGNATLPFLLALADKGWQRALSEDAHLRGGLNVHPRRWGCRWARWRSRRDGTGPCRKFPAEIFGMGLPGTRVDRVEAGRRSGKGTRRGMAGPLRIGLVPGCASIVNELFDQRALGVGKRNTP